LKQFLDALHIDRVILAGHSMAFIELSRFSRAYPERVLKLVWLDAAYDRTSPDDQAVLARNPVPNMIPPWPVEPITSIEDFAATIQLLYPSLAAIWGPEMEADLRANVSLSPEGHVIEKSTDAISSALNQTIRTYSPDYERIHTPMLAFFALHDGHDFLSADFMTAEQQAQVLDYFIHDRHPHIQHYIDQFRCWVPHARIVVIPNGHHYCFLKQADLVYREMLSFLDEG
jgi:pimeloyl-ACP methyl ester carboxylesterase